MAPVDELPSVAAVAWLDVEPATWAGAMPPVDELTTVAASRTW